MIAEPCRCENSTDGHGFDPCLRPATRPAPIMYLEGEPMCEECIAAYIADGYGISAERRRRGAAW
jgi:hypothetical protein